MCACCLKSRVAGIRHRHTRPSTRAPPSLPPMRTCAAHGSCPPDDHRLARRDAAARGAPRVGQQRQRHHWGGGQKRGVAVVSQSAGLAFHPAGCAAHAPPDMLDMPPPRSGPTLARVQSWQTSPSGRQVPRGPRLSAPGRPAPGQPAPPPAALRPWPARPGGGRDGAKGGDGGVGRQGQGQSGTPPPTPHTKKHPTNTPKPLEN